MENEGGIGKCIADDATRQCWGSPCVHPAPSHHLGPRFLWELISLDLDGPRCPVTKMRAWLPFSEHALDFLKIKVRSLFLKFFLSRWHLGSLLCQEILGGISSSKWKTGLWGAAHHPETSGSFVGDGGFHDIHTMASCSLLLNLPLTCKLGSALIGIFEPLLMKRFELRCPKGSTMQGRSTNMRIWEASS